MEGGLTGRVLSTLGHGAPEVMGHLFLSHLHAKRKAWCFSARVEEIPKRPAGRRCPPATELRLALLDPTHDLRALI